VAAHALRNKGRCCSCQAVSNVWWQPEQLPAHCADVSAGAPAARLPARKLQVDYNRAGVPLLEIVSEPDMRTGAEAAAYGAELRRIMRFLDVSGAAEGQLCMCSCRNGLVWWELRDANGCF